MAALHGRIRHQPHHAHRDRVAASRGRCELHAVSLVQHRVDAGAIRGLVDHLDALHTAFARHHRRQRVLRVLSGHFNRRTRRGARRIHFVIEPQRVVVRTGAREHRNDARHRVRALLVRGVQHARRSDDADRGGDGGAESRPHQVHVLEPFGDLRAQRERFFDLQALDHVRRNAQRFDRLIFAGHRRQAAQRRAQLRQLVRGTAASGALVDVLLDLDALVDRQLAVVECLQTLTHVRARVLVDHGRTSRSSSRNVCRARVRRDFTVPIATPRESAISS